MAKCVQCGVKGGLKEGLRLGASLCDSCQAENERQVELVELPPVVQQQYAGGGRFSSTVTHQVDATPPRERASTLKGRYRDAYLVAKVTIGIGSTIKLVGFILAALIFLSGLLFAFFAARQGGISKDVSGGVFFVATLIGSLYAFIVGFVFYVIGVIVSAQGQVLRATLDNTVGNSPFLEDEQKATIMSLPA